MPEQRLARDAPPPIRGRRVELSNAVVVRRGTPVGGGGQHNLHRIGCVASAHLRMTWQLDLRRLRLSWARLGGDLLPLSGRIIQCGSGEHHRIEGGYPANLATPRLPMEHGQGPPPSWDPGPPLHRGSPLLGPILTRDQASQRTRSRLRWGFAQCCRGRHAVGPRRLEHRTSRVGRPGPWRVRPPGRPPPDGDPRGAIRRRLPTRRDVCRPGRQDRPLMASRHEGCTAGGRGLRLLRVRPRMNLARGRQFARDLVLTRNFTGRGDRTRTGG